MYMTVYSF